MSTFADFVPCIHGGLHSTCAVCTGAKKLLLRHNPNTGRWELYGFLKVGNERGVVRWKWIAVAREEARKMLKQKNFAVIEYVKSLNIPEGENYATIPDH